MAFCKTCGADIGDSLVCPTCGEAQTDGASNTSSEQNSNEAPAVHETPDQDVSANKGYAVLSYIGILCLIPLFAAPKTSAYVRVHLTQGLTIFAAEIVISILSRMPVINTFSYILSLAASVFSIWGIVNAAQGTRKKLPLVEKLDLLTMFGMGWPKD